VKYITFIALAAMLAATASAQPSIFANGIVNSASYAKPGLPNAGIAEGSIFTIFGNNIGPSSPVQVSAFPIGTNLGGTTVNVSAGGTNYPAPVIFTSQSQVSAIMPSNVPAGSANVTVGFNGSTSASQPITVVPSSFGVYSTNQQGTGSAVVQNANFQLFTPTSAALPGDVAILWGTGLGPVSFSDAGAPQATNLTNIPAELYIGGQPVNLTYRGRSGCCSGVDQLVFTVPSGVSGCNVSVSVKINNVVSPTTTMPIGSGSSRVCSDPTGFSTGDLSTLLGKSTFNVGSIVLLHENISINVGPPIGNFSEVSDIGSASFEQYTPATFTASSAAFQLPSVGSCTILTASGSSTSGVPVNTIGLDAGPAINIKRPDGTAKQLTAVSGQKGEYSGTLSSGTPPATVTSFLTGGPYAIDNGGGGADVKGFSFSLPAGPPLTWTNSASASTITRSSGFTVTWSGGDPNSYAFIVGNSTTTGTPSLSVTFYCIAPVAPGSFKIGPEVLDQLPASSPSTGGFSFGGFMGVGSLSTPVKFTAPGLDYGSAFSESVNGTGVSWQ